MNWRVILIALGMWLMTGLPIFTGFIVAGPDRVYIGRIPIVAADTTAYYSDIEQARQGSWLFANQFTSEPQRPTLFHPLWLATGWVAAGLHVSSAWAYQIVRLLATWAFVWLLDEIIQGIWPQRAEQWIARAIVLTSSGIGWLVSFGDQNHLLLVPPDRWVAESNTFQSIGHSALFIGSQALLLFWIWTYWRWTTKQLTRLPWWLGPVAGLIMIAHPYDILTLGAVVVAWSGFCVWRKAWNRAQMRQLLILGMQVAAWALVVGLYYFKFVLHEPAMSGWLSQNRDTSPNLLIILLGYGLLIPFAVVGAVSYWKRPATALLVVWSITNFLVLYVPIGFQRRLISGMHIPIALLAAMGVSIFWQRVFQPRFRTLTVIGVALVLAITNGKLLLADVAVQLTPSAVDYPEYISRGEYRAMQYLKAQTTLDDVIYSEVWTGNTIPGLIGRTVVVGHGHQTLHLGARLRDWLAFTKNEMTPAQRTEMLQRLRVTWLYWRAADERPAGYRPETDQRWTLRYQNADVRLYQLQSN